MKNNDLSSFSKFMKQKDTFVNQNKSVWLYTRVSSKDQYDNFSLKTQEEASEKYAKENSYNITHKFGGTYESGSSDLSRKEFSKLIQEVKKVKEKPYAILIYKANRFSRTGGSAINLLMQLVNDYKVHLIEVTTGLSSCSPRDELNFMKKLLSAREENLDRLDVTLPGMIAFLQNGNWLGNVPRGYTQYGPRVTDINRIAGKQEIRINDEGKLLKKAFALKLAGSKDTEIIKMLTRNGMKKVTKQFLSAMWRKPFYCGVNTNKLLDGVPVEGNWEPIITQKEFFRLQSLLAKNKQGYVTDKINENRPLVGILYCIECGKKLTGYEVKNKQVHYYNCPRCKGVIINANSTKRSKGIGANELFLQLTQQLTFPVKYFKLIEVQLKKMFDAKNIDKKEDLKRLRTTLIELDHDYEILEEKHVFNKITPAQYEKYSEKLLTQISQIKEEINKYSIKISNQDEKIKKSLILAQNISNIWEKGTYDLKIRLQKLIFPNGILIDTKNRQYLTKNMNKFFDLITNLSSCCGEKEKGLSNDDYEKSLTVAGT
jgi:site-specific DNA recombinase